jgi:hypothetical protein
MMVVMFSFCQPDKVERPERDSPPQLGPFLLLDLLGSQPAVRRHKLSRLTTPRPDAPTGMDRSPAVSSA